MKRGFCAIAAALMLLCALARADGGIALTARAGYAGTVIEGEWVPVEVEVRAPEQRFDGLVSLDVYRDSETYDRIEMPVSIIEGETQTVSFSVLPQIRQSGFSIVLYDAKGVQAAETEAVWQRSIAQDALVIGMLGVDAELMEAIREVEIRDAHGRMETIGVLPLDENCMMQTDDEMSALDALLIGTFDLNTFGEDQRALLNEWESSGGVLLRVAGIAENLSEEESVSLEKAQVNALQNRKEEAEYLIETISNKLASRLDRGGHSNYMFGSGLTQSLRVGQGRSILPILVLLLAYIAITGVGLYRFYARRDRGWMLWIAIPISAAVCTLFVLILGSYVKINEPTAAQLHITVMDEQGNQRTEESAAVSYATQHRVQVSTRDGSAIERREYAYFSDYGEVNTEKSIMRDRITISDAPAIELSGGASWLVRNLMIKSDRKIEGKLDASAWMEEDGLHVEIDNQTDTQLHSAYLLTEIGYAALGDILPGGTTHTVLNRTQEVSTDDSGDFLILPDTAIPYSTNLYQSIRMLVDPELLTGGEVDISRLSDEVQYERSILSAKLGLANQVRQDGFDCLLVADVPDIGCTPLVIDGKPISKTSELSVLIRQIGLRNRSAGGYIYYPQGTFNAFAAAIGEDGNPSFCEKTAESYYTREQLPDCFGFRLEGISGEEVCQIRVYAQQYRKGEEASFEAYDVYERKWIALEGGLRPILEGERLARLISERGELFLRYAGMTDEAAYRPEIIVEGREKK